ncbi:MAG: hypothetical protein U0X92_09880 [Anaerolineales bacterium]
MAKENKITNEKPVKIPLGFEEALGALLKTKPPTEKRGKKKKPSKPKK